MFIAFHGPRERRSVIICKLTCRVIKIRKEDKGEHSKKTTMIEMRKKFRC